jgi:pyruvate/2-oxoglutarate dehydrogenase complex dihydrolipoamide acyltransferase (E2) component
MKANEARYQLVPYPRNRLLMVDGGRLARRKHTIHGLVEFDITATREAIRRYRQRTGESLSFSAFFLSSLGRAIDADKQMHAYRNWHRQLVLFDEVDVNMLFEVDVEGVKTIRPHILRGVNHKSMEALEAEIRAFQAGHAQSEESRFIELFVRLPGFARRFFLWALLKTPRMVKDYYGTVLVSSVGMFGRATGWGLPVPNHSLQLTLGGVGERPAVINHRVEVRRMMSVTISFDHDVIDGAPAARFTQRLKDLIERGDGLEG